MDHFIGFGLALLKSTLSTTHYSGQSVAKLYTYMLFVVHVDGFVVEFRFVYAVVISHLCRSNKYCLVVVVLYLLPLL